MGGDDTPLWSRLVACLVTGEVFGVLAFAISSLFDVNGVWIGISVGIIAALIVFTRLDG